MVSSPDSFYVKLKRICLIIVSGFAPEIKGIIGFRYCAFRLVQGCIDVCLDVVFTNMCALLHQSIVLPPTVTERSTIVVLIKVHLDLPLGIQGYRVVDIHANGIVAVIQIPT